MIELPPLPVTNVVIDGLWEEQYGPYTADQMREYAEQAIEQAIERCAKVAEEWSKRPDDVGGYIYRNIRALKEQA